MKKILLILIINLLLLNASSLKKAKECVNKSILEIFNNGIKNKNREVLNNYIDFNSLKNSVKSQLNEQLLKDTKKQNTFNFYNSAINMITLALSQRIIEPLVETYVSPEGLIYMNKYNNRYKKITSELIQEHEKIISVKNNTITVNLYENKNQNNYIGVIFKQNNNKCIVSGVVLPKKVSDMILKNIKR